MTDELDPAHEAFLDGTVEAGVVWGVADADGWAVVPSSDVPDTEVMPFWSDESGAQDCCTGPWSGYQPEPIALDGFLEEWLPGLAADGLQAGVNWSAELEGIELPPLELQADLEARILERFESD